MSWREAADEGLGPLPPESRWPGVQSQLYLLPTALVVFLSFWLIFRVQKFRNMELCEDTEGKKNRHHYPLVISLLLILCILNGYWNVSNGWKGIEKDQITAMEVDMNKHSGTVSSYQNSMEMAQNLKYRSTEWKPRNKHIHQWLINLQQMRQDHTTEKRWFLQ